MTSYASLDILSTIARHFRLHPVTIDDIESEDSPREKIEIFQHYLFLVVHSAIHPTPTIFDIVQQEEEELAAAKEAEEMGVRRTRRNLPANRNILATHVKYDTDHDDVNPFELLPLERTSSNNGPRLLTEAELRRGRTGVFRAAGLQTSPIQLVVFPNLVLSFHHGQNHEINSICRHLDHLDETRMDTGQYLQHAILDAAVTSLRPIVNDIDDEVDRLEELVYSLASTEFAEEYADLLKRMGLARRRLVILKQQLKTKQNILNSLIGRDWQQHSTLTSLSSSVHVQTPYLRDVFDHVQTMLVKVDCCSEVLAALQDTYLANVQLRSEKVARDDSKLMKQFSAVATIILPLSLISGIMGMNVQVPSQVWDRDDSTGDAAALMPFWTIIIVMLAITIGSLYLFRRRGYI